MRDLNHALRALWRQRAFSAAAIVTLAVGLGANTALFGLVSGGLRPLAVPDADRIVTIAGEAKDDQSGGFQYAFSVDALKDFQQRATSFSDVFGATPRVGGLVAGGTPLSFFFVAVSENYFPALRIAPAAGRLFSARSGSPVSVVLGHAFWVKHFHADPGVIGRPVRIDGHPAVVTGVVPASFHGTLMAIELDGYVAVDDLGALDPSVNTWLYHNRKAKPMELFARLKPGVSLQAATLEVNAILASLATEYPDSDHGISARVVPEPLSRPLPMRAVSDAIPLVRIFALAVAMLVLLIACLNVANLVLVRATARERELAVRAALGATRLQLVRLMVVEGLALAILGGVAGVVVGQWVLNAFVSRLDIGADLPYALDMTFDWGVFAYSFAVAAGSGIAIGLWPAWRASRADARASLHDGGKANSDGVDRQRFRRVLVIAQIAGALALLTVAGLFLRSLVSAQRVDLGFDADHLLTVRVDPRQVAYDEDRTHEFYRELLRRVTAWPDVAAASQAFSVPMTYLIGGGAYYVEGRTLRPTDPTPVAFFNSVGRDYFDTMGIPIVSGRAFTEDDERARSTTRRVVIVNETFAARVWPGENPVGKRLRIFSTDDPPLEVVGVARDSKYVLVFEAPRPYIYRPIERDTTMRTIHVRAKGDPAPLLPRLEREIASLAPDLPMADLRTMRQSLSGVFGYLIFRLGAIQAGGMGLIGLTLAMVGVYGVVSFSAQLRTREIGIRMALGAEPRDVLRLILGQGVLLIAVGLAIGLASAVAGGRLLTRFLPLADPADWSTFALTAAGLGALALLACYVPARRATKIAAATALRHE